MSRHSELLVESCSDRKSVKISGLTNCMITRKELSWCWTLGGVYTWERVTDLSLVGNCSQAMEGVAGQRPANVARMERKSVDPIRP